MIRVLVVEDNEMNREMLVRRLKKRGFDVREAVNGLEAIDQAFAHNPQIILMDMSLPELDGWEATRRIRAKEQTSKFVIIALTAHAMDGDRERALEAGCDEYETKPVNLPVLLQKMSSLLAASGG